MTATKPIRGFRSFITKFPKAKFPVELNEVSLRKFSLENKPLGNDLYAEFCLYENEETIDEYTEFVACCQLPEMENLHAVVVWQGALLEYHYQLIFFDKTGKILSKSIIGGTKVVDQTFEVVVATMKNSWLIEVKETMTDVEPSTLPNDAFTKPKSIEITADGQVSIPKSFLTYWQ